MTWWYGRLSQPTPIFESILLRCILRTLQLLLYGVVVIGDNLEVSTLVI